MASSSPNLVGEMSSYISAHSNVPGSGPTRSEERTGRGGFPEKESATKLKKSVANMGKKRGYAIKCWDCRSDADSKCADPFDNTTFAITDCDQVKPIPYIYDENNYKTQKSTMCRKIRQKANGVWKYFRSCAFLGEIGIKGDERFCLMRTGTYNIFMEYCTCNSKDGCNTSSHMSNSLLVMTFSLVGSYLFVKIFR